MFDSRKYLVASVVMSLLFHFVLFAVARKMPAYDEVSPLEIDRPQLDKVKLRTVKLDPENPIKEKTSFIDLKLKESPSRIAAVINKNSSVKLKQPALNENPDTKKKKLDDILGDIPEMKTEAPSRELPPNIYHMEVKGADIKLAADGGSGLNNNLKHLELKKPGKGNPLASGSAGGRGEGGESQVSFRKSIPRLTPPDLKFKGSRLKTPGRELGSPGLNGNGAGRDNDAPAELDSFLTVKPYVHIDEQQQTGYFRLDMTFNNKAVGLEPQPKDVIFVVDSSKSISTKQLNQFTAGVAAGLKTLEQNDRFEIVDFTTEPEPLFNGFRKVSPAALAEGNDFIDDFSSGGKTDVYSSLRPFIETAKTTERPILLFVLTDGVSTVTESMENSQLISDVTKRNKAVSVFGFSCGDNINSFLIDFLTYRNRGDSLIVNGTDGAAVKFSDYVSQRSEVIVADLLFRYMGKNKQDVFPKSLPHMYRKRTLSLFGTFDLKEKNIMVHLAGKSSSGKRQLIYRLRYEEAERSGRELAKNWAAQKIFHLIGELTDNPAPETINKIRELQQQFEVYIPYNLPGAGK